MSPDPILELGPQPQLPDSTRGRILALLRETPSTVDELAQNLALTPNAIRVQLAQLERDGLVAPRERRPGVRKPSVVYGVTPRLQELLSRAYVPLLAQLLVELADRLPGPELEAAFQAVGRRLAAAYPRATGDPADRIGAAAGVLADLGGATVREASDAGPVLRGLGCPLAAVVPGHPEVCRAVEALLTQVTGLAVAECCNRDPADPRCCFQFGDDYRSDTR